MHKISLILSLFTNAFSVYGKAIGRRISRSLCHGWPFFVPTLGNLPFIKPFDFVVLSTGQDHSKARVEGFPFLRCKE